MCAKNRLGIVLTALLLTVPAPASEEDLLVLPGVQGIPYIDPGGEPQLVYSDTRGRIFLSSQGQGAGQVSGTPQAAACDGKGRLWLAWESPGPAGGQVHMGSWKPPGTLRRRQLSRGIPGSHHSPHMDLIRHQDVPWTVWINDREGYSCLLAARGRQGPAVVVYCSSSGLFAPRIVLDILGRPWIFWVGKGPQQDAVYFTRWEAGRWLPPNILSGRPAVPNIHPSPAINGRGYPAVAWSAFDGDDYEIFYRSWENGRWSSPEKVTRNRDLADAQPSLASYLGIFPVLAWTQTGERGSAVMLTHRGHSGWQRPVPLTSPDSNGRSPMLVSQGSQMILAWREESRFCARSIDPLQPPRRSFQPLPPPKRLTVRAAESEESSFIAFGDSITYGSMNGPYQGIGYPPRLQVLLLDLFPDPAVFNRGIPGEATWEAVSRIQHILATDLARYLLLKEGTNDVSSLSYSLDTTAFNLEQILDSSLEKGVFPLISTIIPRAGSRWTPVYQERTLSLNGKILDLAKNLGIMSVENYGAFMDFPQVSGGHEALISGDELHPNDLGYQVMAETWFTRIKAVPYPPTGIQAEKSQRSLSVLLTWSQDPKIIPGTDLQKIRIYRKSLGSGALSLIASLPASSRSYEDEKISLDLDYLYQLSSLNGSDIEGPLSIPVKAIRIEPFPPLQVQTRIVVNKSFLAREYIGIVNWQENPENPGKFTIAGYRIYRKLQGQPEKNFLLLDQVAADVRVYRDRGLTSQQQAEDYVYGVSAVDSLGRESPIGQK